MTFAWKDGTRQKNCGISEFRTAPLPRTLPSSRKPSTVTSGEEQTPPPNARRIRESSVQQRLCDGKAAHSRYDITCRQMNEAETTKPFTAIDRLSLILVVLAFMVVGFHFQDSCLASCRACLAGSILAVGSFAMAVARKRSRLMLASVLAFLAHMLLAH